MSKIEINEYVRTEDGIIDKVERFSVGCCVWHCENGMCIDECNCIGTHLENIVNHSKHLIDLIEVGDYVNGELITDKWDTRISSIRSNFSEEDIKTILTKESYMANCYKVGGEDEF